MNETYITSSHRGQEPENKVLYLVGTPIGNLNDFSIRAINILKNVSLIACEDTRNSRKLLNHFGIKNKLISFHKYNSLQRIDYLTLKLEEGNSIALVTDAGMPLISDPGDLLVRKTKEMNLDVICIPGPCAALTALVISGLDSSKFTFYGFMPRSSKERKALLETISESKLTSILYESPKRVVKLLNDLRKFCGGKREITLLKELTKKYEQHFGNNIEQVLKFFELIEPKGEFTLVLSGKKNFKDEKEISSDIIRKDLIDLIKAGLSHSAASTYLSKKTNKSKNEIYKLII